MKNTKKTQDQIEEIKLEIEQVGVTELAMKLSKLGPADDIIIELDSINQDLEEVRLNLMEISSKEIDKNREEIYQGLIEIKETLEKF